MADIPWPLLANQNSGIALYNDNVFDNDKDAATNLFIKGASNLCLC